MNTVALSMRHFEKNVKSVPDNR